MKYIKEVLIIKKIPSLYKRDFKKKKNPLTTIVDDACNWVIEGEGVPTRKRDGWSCYVKGDILYKRYDRKKIKKGPHKGEYKEAPEGWVKCQDPDIESGHFPGWLPVDFSLNDNKYYAMAWNFLDKPLDEGTYELCGIVINNNNERLNSLTFFKHGSEILECNARSYDSIKKYLIDNDIEGIVWHHSDGRMSKIKKFDFGIQWEIDWKQINNNTSVMPDKNKIQAKLESGANNENNLDPNIVPNDFFDDCGPSGEDDSLSCGVDRKKH